MPNTLVNTEKDQGCVEAIMVIELLVTAVTMMMKNFKKQSFFQ